jgi:hypothetical protein
MCKVIYVWIGHCANNVFSSKTIWESYKVPLSFAISAKDNIQNANSRWTWKVVHKTLLIFDCVQTCPASTYVCSWKHPCFWNHPFSHTSTNTFALTCRREIVQTKRHCNPQKNTTDWLLYKTVQTFVQNILHNVISKWLCEIIESTSESFGQCTVNKTFASISNKHFIVSLYVCLFLEVDTRVMCNGSIVMCTATKPPNKMLSCDQT